MAGKQRTETSDTAARILDIGERLVQLRGFNGFSYADVASELDMTKAALHYHFPGKAELGHALIDRYTHRFTEALAEIDARIPAAPDKLEAYAGLYAEVLRGQRMCLCGMLAAEYQTLPDPMRNAVIAFIDVNEAWVEHVLTDGQRDGSITLAGPASDAARLIVSGLEGAMLVARPYDDLARFATAAEGLLAGFTAPPAARSARRAPRRRSPGA
jgi:TetR/AcrR family transcriptional regulator, transcriptional repressor for nem operon